MTPEKFRQWIVILFVASLMTIWVGMGLKFYRSNRYSPIAPDRRSMMRQMQRGGMPRGAAPSIKKQRQRIIKPVAPEKKEAE